MSTKYPIGKRFNHLTVAGNLYRVAMAVLVPVRCDCGTILISRTTDLEREAIKTCGCSGVFIVDNNKYGLSKHLLYGVWKGMVKRCHLPKCHAYENYGGRGIQVCSEWRFNFKVFFDWAIENGWEQGLQLDREDNDGNYTPDNCRFVTVKVNARNKRNTVYAEYNGQVKSLLDWEEEIGDTTGKINCEDLFVLHKGERRRPSSVY